MRIPWSLVALVATACSSSPVVVMDEPPGLKDETPLRARVVGTWEGEAEDGTDTKEPVDLTLAADGRYEIDAGMVAMSATWHVEGDLVRLVHDDADSVAPGDICFRASRVDTSRIEGQWTFAEASECGAQWHAVWLTRVR